MKKLFVILAVLAILSCTAKKKLPVTRIEILPSGNSIVTTEYADSTTVVNLNKEGELIQLPDTTLLDTIRDSSFLYKQ